jgi:hypothetical protein
VSLTKSGITVLFVMGLAVSTFAQPIDLPPDTLITLQRQHGSCFITCPVYSVAIDAHGTVTYEGERGVRIVGRQTARIAPESVATLLAMAEGVHFFDLRNMYRGIALPDGNVVSGSNHSTTIVTITANGRTRRVEDDLGEPDGLVDLERGIDQVAHTKMWVFLEEETVDELRRSGWSASSEAGAKFLEIAVLRDDVAIARALIAAGANMHQPESRLPPLILASSKPMVELLAHAGADPNERPIGTVAARTPLMMTAYKDAAVAEALLAAGAHLEELEDGRSALFYVACAGNWRVVSVLLRAGANARGAADTTALDCARRARQTELGLPRSLAILEPTRPTVQDFDQVIALLERADRRRDH